MPRKSAAAKAVRKSAEQVSAASARDLDRLRAAQRGPIDTSDIPERRGPHARLLRDAQGLLPRRSMIRDAIAREVARRGITAYQLWKEAQAHCPSLSQAAVYEFLKGQRQIGLDYAEALMAATGLAVVQKPPRRPAGSKRAHAKASRSRTP